MLSLPPPRINRSNISDYSVACAEQAEALWQLASDLSQDPDPAKKSLADYCYRGVINRAYYSAFHHACEFLKRNGIDIDDRGSARGGSHTRLVDELLMCVDNNAPNQGKRVSRIFESLRVTRNAADYHDTFPKPQPNYPRITAQSACMNLVRDVNTVITRLAMAT